MRRCFCFLNSLRAQFVHESYYDIENEDIINLLSAMRPSTQLCLKDLARMYLPFMWTTLKYGSKSGNVV